MKTIRKLLIMISYILPVEMHAQTTHWNYDPYAYQYDMAVYLSLSVNGTTVDDMTNYEIAAFCNDECRGIAKVQSVGDKQYGYIRIRSNDTEGETITFKVFDINKQEETDVEGATITFKADSVVGVPSSPLILSITITTFTPGDVDGDGVIDLADAMLVINYYLGKPMPKFVMKAADVDSDGKIDFTDAMRIINFYLGR